MLAAEVTNKRFINPKIAPRKGRDRLVKVERIRYERYMHLYSNSRFGNNIYNVYNYNNQTILQHLEPSTMHASRASIKILFTMSDFGKCKQLCPKSNRSIPYKIRIRPPS